MNKDLTSFEVHNSQYIIEEVNNVQSVIDDYHKFDKIQKFSTDGFDKAIKATDPLPKTHIDIGSGLGWVVRKTSALFETVYAVEPSAKATELASKALAQDIPDRKNIIFINKDMVDALDEIKRDPSSRGNAPLFFTTSVVLSHINNAYVSSFLAKLADVADGSALFFDERYGKNIQWRLWYIRGKEWWAKQLPDWQLSFYEIENTGYASGIYAVKVGKANVKNTFALSAMQKLGWSLQGAYYATLGIIRKIFRRGL